MASLKTDNTDKKPEKTDKTDKTETTTTTTNTTTKKSNVLTLEKTKPSLSPSVNSPSQSSKVKAIWKRAFDKIDTDNSGEIDCSELERLFESMYMDSSPESIQKCLKFLDKDENGSIEFDEFLKWGLYTWENQVLKPTSGPGVADLGLSPRMETLGLLKRTSSRGFESTERGSTTILEELNSGKDSLALVNEGSEEEKGE